MILRLNTDFNRESVFGVKRVDSGAGMGKHCRIRRERGGDWQDFVRAADGTDQTDG